MKFPIPASVIGEAFLAACRAELRALKPGNVHIHSSGHGMDVQHFEQAAVAAAPYIAEEGARVGRRIRCAVEASLAAAQCNTNLGIILLCAPLAYAACEAVTGTALSQRLGNVLSGLDGIDAADAFAGIAKANPGGLGEAESGDVRSAEAMPLLKAMALASNRDRIALAYVTGYADIFEFALPLLKQARKVAETPELAVTTLHMNLLARFADTHIARKFGPLTAEQVRHEARRRLNLCQPVTKLETLGKLEQFDALLKAHGLNPGTTADFVVATLFTEALSSQVAEPSGV
ncbi:MAG: triphosphoribosyl-dephospho-CoA synthase [Alphaproteobacteria bacterium BRH_c36]|nr:MAG: triphosphoribosyl-dephospho-CoA synthase [Alphaproteobacteria bacterium BRH_c36]